ncbi:MAG: N-acetylmuramoyl-L-alanine amidase, partial [Acetatifactor sp.]|nr:N-acetylmuramoyl-L-alanine amidase [Acetatifactor sp.]
TISLEDRVKLANENGATIYISIHQNACEERESSVSGIETWYYGGGEGSRRLAQLVHQGALEKTGANDREIRETDELYVIREASMPSCLIETAFLSNRKEREKITDPAYQEKLAAGIAQGIQYYFYPKTMYLTFDDGPSEENTTAVLDILKERGIKATFFLVGKNVEKHPEVARRIAEEGHTIGIHCYSHDYGEIYASVDAYLEDFQKAWNVVYETTGVEVELFRFPGGSINAYNKDVYEDIIDVMTEQGYVYFDWNASLEDAAKKTTPEMLLQNARESTLGRKKVVMLAHDIQYNTVLCLEALIDQFPEYKMEPLSIEVTPIQF